MGDADEQLKHLNKAARDTDANLNKEEFARVIGGLAKPIPPTKEADEDQATDD